MLKYLIFVEKNIVAKSHSSRLLVKGAIGGNIRIILIWAVFKFMKLEKSSIVHATLLDVLANIYDVSRETLMGKHKIGNPRELNLFFF